MPRLLPAEGVNRDQDATASMCLVEGEGDMGGVGVGSFPDTEDDLPVS
ncbi:hypothetical protein GCM10010250_06990 [Streptomyces althioticus]|uniref:Uncharacterized protein n=1 Tax=Streptomyces pseudogriseolus TaxID=36817 RepID=A0ABQ2SXP1_STREZ|nr:MULTISPECIES: hypothetical protein [Actinomycetes]WTC27273.1 hypothetical protein OG872_33325 [Streptomyces althioticus]GGT37576.1 hypothetical protein GCM10010243_13140 [Streptomyces matensis]MCI4142405.1 hypothetical protein [Streptomyces sp. MMS20-AI2-20]GGQ39713.1 hypothetical protein GCM10010250_06990 [Streptomyces althioticus]GGS41425.1 hypothetical protein GCM10010285_21060 [Streptomyces rubiginosus]